MAANTGQKVTLRFRFNALGNHPQTEALAQGDDSAANRGIVGIGEQVTDEGLINLQLAQRQSLQVGKR